MEHVSLQYRGGGYDGEGATVASAKCYRYVFGKFFEPMTPYVCSYEFQMICRNESRDVLHVVMAVPVTKSRGVLQ